MANLAASKLRAQLADPDSIIVCPVVQDGLSALVCLQQGFNNLYMTGAGTAMSLLGMPDLGLTTADDMVRNASMIASIDRTAPVIADADIGFPSWSPAQHTERYVLGGVAGLYIEDQVATKRCGYLLGKEIVDIDTFVSRIRAAAAARDSLSSNIVIIARTDSLQPLSSDEAVRRLQAAVIAVADVKQIVEVMKPTLCLLNMVAGGVAPLINSTEAHALGFKIVIWPYFATTAAAYLAYQPKVAKELQATGAIAERRDRPDGIAVVGVQELFELCGLSEYTAFDEDMGSTAFSDGV
ncbi:Phosphoenolpyruvate/pyruvate domain-containing protein [Immersiella caudata]|uniref:Phosphoenolpyruvate/pyruvate domain-containing protein n=1 Tax=Immersiella caudata TaxID=314043 RepID=A0AA40C3B2_9PEZI|nr:Phosphoenolpyruvate/pyruvate domain-containing protein [Immersiella caudata]